MKNTRITVAQFELERLPHWIAFEDKMVRLVEKAKDEDSELLGLGEYVGLELAGWTEGELAHQFEYIQTQVEQYKQLFSSLAQQYNLYIQPGSLPVKVANGYRNRAFIFSPNGDINFQDKIHLTPLELHTKLIQPGTELRVFNTTFGGVGIATCYGIEFPNVINNLCRQGAQLLLVPSFTEKLSGLTRVSISCRARAIENQCYVAQACFLGKASWCDFIDINVGQSGVYGPADTGFPDHGILAQAHLNTPMLTTVELNWEKINYVRKNGDMRNYNDMQTDVTQLLKSIDIVKMTT